MISKSFSSGCHPLHAYHAALVDLTPLRPPRSTKHTNHLAITKVSHGKNLYDLLVTTKGRTPQSATIVFENIPRSVARSLLAILIEKSPPPAAMRDPVRSITILNNAIDYANIHNLTVHTPSGRAGHDDLSRFFDAEIETFSQSHLKEIVDRREIGEGIYHLAFPNQPMMNAAFMRPQEHYEGPKFRGKVFTAAQCKEWYRHTRPHKEFSYYTDWGGFNLPDDALMPFFKGAFGTPSPLENIILEACRGAQGPFYLIGTLQDDARGTLRHEIAHALYHTNSTYRTKVNQALLAVNLNPIFRHLKGMGYHHSHWKDEAHAYLGDAPADLEVLGINSSHYRDVQRRLLRIYNEHSPIKHSW